MHENKECLQTWKKGLDIQKHPWLYSICRCIEEKSFLWKRLRLDLISQRQIVFFFYRLFSSRLDFLWSYFLKFYWQPPAHIILGKYFKNIKLRTYFHWHFVLGLLYQSFYLQFFIPIFFLATFLQRFLYLRAVSEFNKFKPRLKSPKIGFNWAPAKILKNLKPTIFEPRLKFNRGWNSLNSASIMLLWITGER